MKDMKKKPAAKKNEPKKAGFYPKVKTTKTNGMNTYK
tara:strand:+ start:138 stop:248 length:111 start_codon:yes stop_codon:yes gene_type:complete